MGDRSFGEIQIFGKLTRDKAEELLGAVEGDNPLIVNGANRDMGEFNLADIIAEGIREDGQLTIVNPYAQGGEFDIIEGCCQENGLGFIRFSEADLEYDAEKIVFDPDWGPDAFRVEVTQNGETVVKASDIRRILDNAQNNDEAVNNISTMLEQRDPELNIRDKKLTADDDALGYLQECASQTKEFGRPYRMRV